MAERLKGLSNIRYKLQKFNTNDRKANVVYVTALSWNYTNIFIVYAIWNLSEKAWIWVIEVRWELNFIQIQKENEFYTNEEKWQKIKISHL